MSEPRECEKCGLSWSSIYNFAAWADCPGCIAMSAGKRIQELQNKNLREPDWDSYGAEPVTDAAIDAAKELLRRWDVVPCSHGGMQIEVHSNGWDIEIEIGSDGKPLGAIIGRAGDDIVNTYVVWPKDDTARSL